MDNLNELEEYIKGLIDCRWICVELRLIGFEDNSVPDSLINEIKGASFKRLPAMLNFCEVVFTFDSYYHKANRFTSTELAHTPNLDLLFRAVTRDSILQIANTAFHAKELTQ